MAQETPATTKSLWRNSFMLGILGALIVAGVHMIGLDYRAELHAVNWRFRNHSATKSLENIVHIDIDDGSLEQLGRWPWPREKLAGLIESLSRCGAKKVVLDIILPTPEHVRYVNPAAEVSLWDRQGEATESPARPIFDDALLARAIRLGRDVFVPMHVALIEKKNSAKSQPRVFDTVPYRKNPKNSAMSFADFLAVTSALAQKTPGGEKVAVRVLAKIYLSQRGLRAMERFSLPGDFAKNLAVCNSEMTPPFVTLAEAAHGSGFVTFVPDADSMVRRIPLLSRCGGKFYPQLAFAVAVEVFATKHGGDVKIASQPGYVILTGCNGTAVKIPVDRAGSMLVDWARWSWLNEAGHVGAGHLSAAYVADVWLDGRKLKKLDNLAQMLRMRFLGMGFPADFLANPKLTRELAGLIHQLDDAYKARIKAEGEYLWSQLFAPSDGPGRARVFEKLRRDEDTLEEKLRKLSAQLVEKLRTPEIFEKFVQGSKIQAQKTLTLLDSLPAERIRIETHRAERIEKIRTKVSGKICFIGSTSTGAPDFVPTPLNPRTPGVVVHSNILNTILTGRFIRQSGQIVNLLVIVAAGALIAFIAATRPVLQAGLATILLAAGYYALNAYVFFGLGKYWLVLIAPLASMLASFLVVTVYRQLTEERAKRQIKDMFAHAVSPALMNRMLEDPSLIQLGGHSRKLSFLFSDLGGFTSLAEQLGPQETVRLLNRYFDGVTDVIQNRRGGYLNKFLGDGVFALFGALIVQENHAAMAIQSAVDCQQAVDTLNAQLDAEGHQVRLTVRIGVTTGEAMVGNCGSSERFDYTAIGDNVNLAARLEAANKFFGSNILIDETTWLEGKSKMDDGKLLARPLGRVYVTGQAKPLWIWEIQGRADTADTSQRKAMTDFTQAIEFFKQRKYAEAIELLEALQASMPNDKPTEIYLELSRQGLSLPAGQDPQPVRSGAKGVDRIALPWETPKTE